MSKLIELAERVEALAGPDREVDFAIARTLGWREVGNPTCAMGLMGRWYHPDGKMTDHLGSPRYTASLDAAMTLVPEGNDALVRLFPNGKGGAHVYPGMRATLPMISAVTPPLALTAAALRALAAQETNHVD